VDVTKAAADNDDTSVNTRNTKVNLLACCCLKGVKLLKFPQYLQPFAHFKGVLLLRINQQ